MLSTGSLKPRVPLALTFLRSSSHLSSDDSDSDFPEEESDSPSESPFPITLFDQLVSANPPAADPLSLFPTPLPVLTLFDIAGLLCLLIPNSAQIEMPLSLLRRLVELDELDLSDHLRPPLAHALIDRFPALPAGAPQCFCLTVLHRTANTCDDTLLFRRLIGLTQNILTRTEVALPTIQLALLLMIEFIPIGDDDMALADTIRRIFWRHSQTEALVVMLMTQFVMKRTGVPLLDSAICLELFDRFAGQKRRIIELFDCIVKNCLANTELLVSHGIFDRIVGWLHEENVDDTKQRLMVLLARLFQSCQNGGAVLSEVLEVLKDEMTGGAFACRVHALLTWITIVKSCGPESVVDEVFLVGLIPMIESLGKVELFEVLSGLVWIGEHQPGLLERMKEIGLIAALELLVIDSPDQEAAECAMAFCHRMGMA
jgi:hypothetical protein